MSLVGRLTADKMNYAALTFGFCVPVEVLWQSGYPQPGWMFLKRYLQTCSGQGRKWWSWLRHIPKPWCHPLAMAGTISEQSRFSHEITDLLKRSEKRLQKLSMKDSSEDSNVRKNVQVMIEPYLALAVTIQRVTVCSFFFRLTDKIPLAVMCSVLLLRTCKTCQWSSEKNSRHI